MGRGFESVTIFSQLWRTILHERVYFAGSFFSSLSLCLAKGTSMSSCAPKGRRTCFFFLEIGPIAREHVIPSPEGARDLLWGRAKD